MKTLLIPLIALGALPLTAQDNAVLKPGDKAPPLVSGEFLQGEPVKQLEPGKTYIVEFWATWCGPCVATIPHVNELHKKFAGKGLIVIGQNIMERDVDGVKPFIEKMGDKMTYRVALDDTSDGSKGKMYQTWFNAADQDGIPAAIIVNKEGVIAWIGHPAGLKEKTVASIMDGSYDIAAAAEAQKKQEEISEKIQPLMAKIQPALDAGKYDDALGIAKEVEALDPDAEQPKQIAMMIRLEVYSNRKKGKELGETALTALEGDPNPRMLNSIAWVLATREKDLDGLDPTVAVKLAQKAADLTENKLPDVLNTLARAQFLAGEKDAAVTTVRKALETAGDDAERKEELGKSLESLEKGELPAIPSR